MASVTWGEQTFELKPGETVLDGLLRNGIQVPYHCRVGACQTCLLKATEGEPPKEAVDGLSATLRAKGLFYSCVCVPDEDLTVQSGL